MLLGSVLALTNLYIGAKTGWSLGVGITSVILSFALFKVLSKLRLGSEMTILENNAMQSIATSAGYFNSALFTSFAAYTMVTPIRNFITPADSQLAGRLFPGIKPPSPPTAEQLNQTIVDDVEALAKVLAQFK